MSSKSKNATSAAEEQTQTAEHTTAEAGQSSANLEAAVVKAVSKPATSGSTEPMIGTVHDLVSAKIKLNGVPLDKNGVNYLRRFHFGQAITVNGYVNNNTKGRPAEVYKLSDAPGISFSL